MKKLILISILILLFLACSQNVTVDKSPQEVKIINPIKNQLTPINSEWVEVTTSVQIHDDITKTEAREKAMQNACVMALEYFGVEVDNRTLLINAESNFKTNINHFSEITKLTTNGIILGKEILDDSVITVGNNSYQTIKMKIKVGKQKGEKDPYFRMEAQLNRDQFKENDFVEISIKPTIDCYVTVFYIASDESVGTIFPNCISEDNFVKANEILQLPEEGVNFKVTLLPNRTEDTEMIKIIATKKPLNFQVNDDFKTAFEALQNWIVTIPRHEITETDLQYLISK